MSRTGQLEAFGVPAALVTSYLDQHSSIVVETTQSFSILFLFSMGATRGKWGSLVTALFDFKRDLDRNAPLTNALPGLLDVDAQRTGGWDWPTCPGRCTTP